MINTTIYSLMLTTLMLVPHGNFVAAIPTMFVCGAAAAGLTVVTRAITGDIGDEIRLDSGRDWMGLLYAMTNATQKLASAASIFLTFNVLEKVGYDAKAEKTVNTPSRRSTWPGAGLSDRPGGVRDARRLGLPGLPAHRAAARRDPP